MFNIMTKKASKLNSTIIANIGARRTLRDCKLIKNPFNKNKVTTTKNNNYHKLQVVFTNKTRLGNNFCLKDWVPKDLTTGVVYKLQCGLRSKFYYGECETLECKNC